MTSRLATLLRWEPPLLRGLSWPGIALVVAFVAVWSLGNALHPRLGGGSVRSGELLATWFAYTAVFLVGGACVLLTAVVAFNLAGRVAVERFGVALLAGLMGAVAGAVASHFTDATLVAKEEASGLILLATWLDWALLLAAGHLLVRRAQSAREQAYASALRPEVLEKERSEARLRLLQAQIEPHFLFNTLSNVRRLGQSDAGGARAMLQQLSRYLHAALPRMRQDQVSLAEELELVAAYLALQQTRMGERLQVRIDVAEADRACRVPSMILATLVENAIKHGIGPLVAGGSIAVRSRRSGEQLVLTVADTGRGFTESAGTGVGLANIRQRLAAAYGERASLTLSANTPQGLVADISLPCPAGGAIT